MSALYEQERAKQTLDALTAAHDSLLNLGQRSSAGCVERALDELDTASCAEIARMFERNRSTSK